MINRKSEFEVTEQEISEFARAISHPARLSILKILAQQKECCGDIVNLLPLAQSTVSQHLKQLKDAGIIKGEIQGPKISYCLNMEKIEKFIRDFDIFFKDICSVSTKENYCQ